MYYIRLFSPIDGRWAWRSFSSNLIRQLTALPGAGLLTEEEAIKALSAMRNLDPYALFEIKHEQEEQPARDFLRAWQPSAGYP